MSLNISTQSVTCQNDIKAAKTALRRSLLQQRTSLAADAWRQKSDRLCQHLQDWLVCRGANTVLSYVSFRQEPDLSSLIRATHLAMPGVWGLPRCVEQQLCWHRWTVDDPLLPNRFGILEPHATAPTIAPQQVDVVLVPAVACDSQGYRLGYGGGFYDRMLSHPDWHHAVTIGIVFEESHLPLLPVASWDMPLHGVCTEAGLFLQAEN
jgi:5-formyltetrahydrofolate cyclo-ligase